MLTKRTNSCVYIALDVLLGDKWSTEGRAFCADIINEFDCFPGEHILIIPEFAPIKFICDSNGQFSFTYDQKTPYVTFFIDGKRWRISEKALVFCVFSHSIGSHAVCVAAAAIQDLKYTHLHCVAVYEKTPIIIDNIMQA